MKVDKKVLDHFGLRGDEKGDVQVHCPFHDDDNKSASINLSKGLLHCFGGCAQGWTLKQVKVALALQDEEPATEDEGETEERMKYEEVTDVGGLTKASREFLKARGLGTTRKQLGCRVGCKDGYLFFGAGYAGWPVGRNMQDDDRPRYWNKPGKKELFVLDTPKTPERGMWLAEGVLDALAIRKARPNAQVAATLGASALTDAGAYELRRHTVFVLFDLDYQGYKGANKAVEKLIEFKATPIVLELPDFLGNDPGYAQEHHPALFKQWLDEQQMAFSADDQQWIDSIFVKGEAEPLVRMSTGVASLDDLLGGGLCEGCHAWGGETGTGKTSLATRFAVENALRGLRGLFVTYEIPKRQQWARVASCEDPQEWNTIEVDPTSVQPKTKTWLTKLSRNLRVVSGWDVGKVTFVADDYDFIVVDYLQRMPGVYKGDGAERLNIEHNITQLANLGRDKGKVVVAVQRLRNTAQGVPDIDAFYGSSAIRYVVQSGLVMRAIPGQQRVIMNLGKNTRGMTGTVICETELGHQQFLDRGEYISGPANAGNFSIDTEALRG